MSIMVPTAIYCERGRVVEDNINSNNQPWGRKGTSPYMLACTVKSRPSPTAILTTKRGKGRERCLLIALAGLSSYLCRLCPMYVNLSRLGGGINPNPPPTICRR